MKKILSIFMLLSIMFIASSCSNGGDGGDGSSDSGISDVSDLFGGWRMVSECSYYTGADCSDSEGLPTEEDPECYEYDMTTENYYYITFEDNGYSNTCYWNQDDLAGYCDENIGTSLQEYTLSGNMITICSLEEDPGCSGFYEGECETWPECYWDNASGDPDESATCNWEEANQDPCNTGTVQLNDGILIIMMTMTTDADSNCMEIYVLTYQDD